MSGIEVAELSFYPIKACGGINTEQAALTEFGLEFDREWMLVGAKGQPLTQRNHPELATVQTRIEDDALIAVAPGMGELAISLDRNTDASEVAVTLWKKSGTGNDEGPEATRYFTEFLGAKSARLLRVQQPRAVDPDCRLPGASAQIGFADGFPMLLTSTGSLTELNGSLTNLGADPVPMNRFRPNIIVAGASAYEEDYWGEIQIGDMRAFLARACARCSVPNIDQAQGVLPPSEDRHVTAALRATRQGIDPFNGKSEVFFGQNAAHVFEPGLSVKVGDPVTVLQQYHEPNFRQL